jgi:predicted methyltransferase
MDGCLAFLELYETFGTSPPASILFLTLFSATGIFMPWRMAGYFCISTRTARKAGQSG